MFQADCLLELGDAAAPPSHRSASARRSSSGAAQRPGARCRPARASSSSASARRSSPAESAASTASSSSARRSRPVRSSASGTCARSPVRARGDARRRRPYVAVACRAACTRAVSAAGGRAPRTSGGRARRPPRPRAGERRVALQRVCVRDVQGHALARKHVVVDGVARQRVAERVARSRRPPAGGARPPRAGRPAARPRGPPRRPPAAAPARRSGGGDRAQDPPDRLGHPFRAASSTSRSDGGRRSARRRPADPEHLLHEEGVAVGALEDAVDERGLGLGPQDRLELLGHLGAGEARQVEALHRATRSSDASSGRSGWLRCTSSDR